MGRSSYFAEDNERKSPVSANPTKTSPTWAITLLLQQLAAVKSLAASPGVSSNASLSVHQANQKAKTRLPMEEQAHWITNYRGSTWLKKSVLRHQLLLSEELPSKVK